ncbi:hypothetical protein BGZ83_005177 [Gryganskiella cystojenkinii]|nr:hypothetical protein BGZ83_005177 [Gryganskiella cystojenkinii]
MGNLTLFCVTQAADGLGLYGTAFGWNSSDFSTGQLIFLIKGTPSVLASNSTQFGLTNIVWDVISIVQQTRVFSITSTTLTSFTCAVSPEGIFTFLAENTARKLTIWTDGGPPGGFRYDPTLNLNIPAVSTVNLVEMSLFWSNVTVMGRNLWTEPDNWDLTSTVMFYVMVTTNSTGPGSHGRNLVLTSRIGNTIQLSEEISPGSFQHCTSLDVPTTYMSVFAHTFDAGQLYLLGNVATGTSFSTILMAVPMKDCNLSTLPLLTDLKIYNISVESSDKLGSCSAKTGKSHAFVTIVHPSFYFLCVDDYETLNTSLYTIADLQSNTSVAGPPTALPPFGGDLPTFVGFFTNSASNTGPQHPYGVYHRYNGMYGVALDSSGISATDYLQYISIHNGAEFNYLAPLPTASNGNSGGNIAVVISIIVAVVVVIFGFSCWFFRRRSNRAGTENVEVAQSQRELNKPPVPVKLGTVILEHKLDGQPLSLAQQLPPPLQPRPYQPPSSQAPFNYQQQQEQQKTLMEQYEKQRRQESIQRQIHQLQEQLQQEQHQQQPLQQEYIGASSSSFPAMSPIVNVQPYTPKPFQPASSQLGSSSPGGSIQSSNAVIPSYQEQFRQGLQLSNHPKPSVVMTVNNTNSSSPQPS